MTDKYEKHRRWRRKMVQEGRCPKCGKESFPFYYCAKHRMRNNLAHGLRRLIKNGVVVRVEGVLILTGKRLAAKGYKIKQNDPRKLPRFGNMPMSQDDIDGVVVEFLNEVDRPVSEREIIEHLVDVKNAMRVIKR